MKFLFQAHVDDLGVLSPDDPVAWRTRLRKLRGKRVVLTLEPPRKGRSINENNYYFGVCCTMVARETGHTAEEIHNCEEVQKLRRVHDEKLGWIVRSTTTFSTVEMEDYLMRFRAWAASFLGLSIPLPNEVEVSL